MGADFIGWRSCPLQEELGQEGFLGKLKLRAYRTVIEERVPEDRWETVEIVLRVTGRPDREIKYGDICRELDAFEPGIPECATCPLAGNGKALGCYRYVTYPIDAVTERLVFERFVAGVEVSGSLANQLFRDIVSRVDEEAGWYGNRGQEGALAELDGPLVHAWEDAEGKHAVDSAQVLAALFIPLDEPPMVLVYARFWAEFFDFVEGKLELAAPGDALADEIKASRTLSELRHVSSMLTAAVPGAMQSGWTVVVDG